MEKSGPIRQKVVLERRLDNFLVSDYFQDYIKYTNVILAVNTDYSAVTLKLSEIGSVSKDQPYWKFSKSLLSDSDLVKSTRSKINEVFEENNI